MASSLSKTRPRARQRWLVLAGLVVVVLGWWGIWRMQTARFPVTLVIGQDEVVLLTRDEDPTALLTRLGYRLRPEDAIRVEGAWGPHARVILQRAVPIQVLADGRSQTIWTRAKTAGAALERAGIELAPNDVLLLGDVQISPDAPLPAPQWLPPDHRRTAPPWALEPIPLTMTILRAVPVTVVEEGGVTRTLWTRAETVEQALAEHDIHVESGDIILPQLDSPIQAGMHIHIRRAWPITIQVAGRSIEMRTRAKRVGDALREAGILPTGEDQVHPPLDALLVPGMTIRVTRISEQVVYEEELLPFETVWEPDDTLLIDTRRVGQEGHPGVLRRRYRVRYEDGQEVARTLEDEWVAVEPVKKVILYGRKIVPRTAMTPDGPITYWRKIRAYTTSYSPSRSGTDPSLPWYGRTRLGYKAGKGIVGVDPSVINMSQKLYIPGYGFAIAGDTGSGLSGRHVDLGFSDEDYESWHWWSDVYLLWPPPPPYAINYILPNWPRYKGTANPYQGLVQEEP